MQSFSFPCALSYFLLPLAAMSQAQQLAVKDFPLGDAYKGAFIQPLVMNTGKSAQWIIASQSKGIVVVDSEGKVLSKLDIKAEFIDLRRDIMVSGKPTTLVATVIDPDHRPGLLTVDSAGILKELSRLPAPTFQIENLCLQQDVDKNVYLYLLDERGIAEQWLVMDSNGKPQVRHVRNLPIAPNSKTCSVDDQQGIFYIAEEDVGVWGYNASPEASPGRWPVDLAVPFGKLSGGAETLTVVEGGVLAVSIKGRQLHSYKTKGSDAEAAKIVDIASIGKPERISRSSWIDDKTLEILVYDDDIGIHRRVTLPWDSQKQPEPTNPVNMVEVYAEAQTAPMVRFGDTADDPAIWVHPRHPKHSRVLATNKQAGMLVYDLQGRELQFLPTGKINNLDLRYGLHVGKKIVDLAIASDRDDNSLALYTIDSKTGVVKEAGSIPTTLDDIYGFCMYQPATREIYAIANNTKGEFQQYLVSVENGKIGGRLVRSFKVDSQPEGCVADDENHQLFVGEEDVGVWVTGADPDSGAELKPVARVGAEIVDDIEGMGLYKGEKQNYLVFSSQGNNSYIVLEAKPPYRERGVFRIGVNSVLGIDAVSETDGLEVTSKNLGGVYSEGMLIVQDGHKVMPETPQNFKYVAWKNISKALGLE